MAPKLSKEFEKQLNDAYYNDKNYVGRDRLFRLLQNNFPDSHPSQVQVAEWLADQKVNQLHQRPKKAKGIVSIVVKRPNIYYQADLVDMGKYAAMNKRYIFTLIDGFSRKAFAVAMKNKNETSILKNFEKLLSKVKADGKTIKLLQTDNGSEFIDKQFKDYLKKNNIKQHLSQAGAPQSNGLIERFNQNLKSYIFKDITATGKNKWPQNLDKYLDNYNNSFNTTIKSTPNMAEDKKNNEKVYDNIKKASVKHRSTKNEILQINDRVRIKLRKSTLDKKSTKNFSNEIYRIYRINKSDKPNIDNKYRLINNKNELLRNFFQAGDLLKVLRVKSSPTFEQKVLVKKPAGSKTAKKEIVKREVQPTRTSRNVKPIRYQ